MKTIIYMTILGLNLSLIHCSSAQTDVNESRQKLIELRSFIGEDAYNFLITSNLNTDVLTNCRITKDTLNPDQESALAKPSTMARVDAWREVMEYGGGYTGRGANLGIINYMRDSLVTNSDFFKASFQFYTWLHERDLLWHKNHYSQLSSLAPIEVKPDDNNIYEKALEFSGGNGYLALKVMSLYGHDNMVNQIAHGGYQDDCRWKILDSLKPGRSSQLYQNGAINTVHYSSEQIANGQSVGNGCVTAFNNLIRSSPKDGIYAFPMYGLCNDYTPSYQADYYHTIAGAFLSCRGQMRVNASQVPSIMMFGVLPKLVDATTGVGHRLAIYQYKITRFEEEVAAGKIQDDVRLVLKAGLRRLTFRLSPFGSEYTEFRKNSSEEMGHMVEAILKRYEHEVHFREYQSVTQGAAFGNTTCSEITSYSTADSAESSQTSIAQGRADTSTDAGLESINHPSSLSH